jgi:hypothetical protein
MTKQTLRRLAAAALCLGAMGTSLAQLSAGRTGANPGDTLQLHLNLAAARGDNLYLAAQVGGSFYFFDEAGGLSPYTPGATTPRRRAGAGAGRQSVLELAVPEGLDATVSFHAAFGAGGGDILATPGAIDMGTLQSVSLDVTPIPGGPSYAANCQSCHDYDPTANVDNILAGRDAAKIQAAIAADKGGMGALSFLSVREIAAISYWIQNPRFDCH